MSVPIFYDLRVVWSLEVFSRMESSTYDFLSWGIALFEYVLMVPANRIGYGEEGYSAFQLKILQEIITISVFILFASLVLKEKIKWNHAVSFLLILAAVGFAFYDKSGVSSTSSHP